MENKVAIFGAGLPQTLIHSLQKEHSGMVIVQDRKEVEELAEKERGLAITNPYADRPHESTKTLSNKTKSHYTPPRSMTAQELEYYQQHKTLAGLSALTPKASDNE